MRSLSSVAEQPLHRALGLTDWEFDRIRELLDRDPNHFELAVFSLLWSEHCGYKHSAPLLKRLPSRGERVLQGPGENAGVIDVGDGIAVAFKAESHNHPSAVEPFQGAATGVGGILRDIVAMGARPIALLDGLWFGEPNFHFRQAVAGIGHYGNCLAADERVLFRNSGRVRSASIGELAEARADADGESWTEEPVKPFEVLSLDPATLMPEWRPVSRLFKRQAASLLRIETRLGRSCTVTPDHPVLLCDGETLVERPARLVRAGDRVPLLCALPETARPSELDLLEDAPPDVRVQLPPSWRPSDALRRRLRDVLERADARHYWLSRRELPIGAFRAVEDLVDVARTELRLRLPGPRSTSVPAILPLNADVARLLGYYIAEGCSSPNGTTTKIVWTFGADGKDARWVADVQEILGRLEIRHSVERRASTIAITVSSRLLGSLLDRLEIGHRAHEKRIPPELFADRALRAETVKTILRGDGSIELQERGSSVRIRHATTSRALHDQLLLAFQSVGSIPSAYVRPARKGQSQGRDVHAREAFCLEVVGHESVAAALEFFERDERLRLAEALAPTASSPHSHPRSKRHDAIASVEVVDVSEVPGPAPVYDFEVPGTHLFATSGGVVTHNCVGVPTVGGATVFDTAYYDNCLVNAMCVGVLPAERLTRAKASGAGNLVVLFGATTGRDGIGGASVLASQELGEEDADKRPTVQVGDPFTGKKLIEVSVEIVESGLVESLQDCGAAGLASSLSEMAAECGIDVHLDRVPLREEGMEPWEVMISESQERMVAVVRPQMLDAVRAVCDRWELPCTVIGEVTESGALRCLWGDEVVGDIPALLLTEECPRYEVERRAPPEPAPVEPKPLSAANRRDKRWIWEQYDHLVGSRTVRRPGLDAAVLRLRPSLRGLAVTLDGPPVGERDPFRAGALAVLGAARNVACAGGEPLALTDCLNFGNPEKPEIAWELEQAIEGISQVAEALGIPVVSGNVSLYNETDGRPIPPTPVIGCVGLVEDVRRIPSRWGAGDLVFVASAVTPGELAAEVELVGFLWRSAPLLTLAHDVSDGGLELALEEAAAWSGIDARVELPADARGGAAILACRPEHAAELRWPALVQIGEVAA